MIHPYEVSLRNQSSKYSWIFTWNGSHPNWLSGPLNGQNFVGVSNINTAYLNGFHIAEGKEGIVSITFAHVDPSILLYYLSTPQGTLVEM